MHRPVLKLLPLCLAIACTARAQDPVPSEWVRCPATGGLPVFRASPAEPAAREGAATDIQADDLDVSQEQTTVFRGNVELERGDQWLGTDTLRYRHDQDTFETEGPVRYQDRSLRLRADQARGDQKADTVELEGVQYQFNDTAGNGSAGRVVMKGATGELTDGTYSTCPPADRQWEFSASEITVDQDAATGTARNATLRIGGVPVMWLPYVSFPTDDRRRSGLLAPTIGNDDRNGFELELPVYLNLAPNYDATLSPRYLSERGLMLGAQFRYLTPDHRGEINGNWLPSDDVTGDDRGLFGWRHFSRLGEHWYASANVNDVSDTRYFSDFGRSLSTTSISLLGSDLGVYGRGRGWTASVVADRWQIANPLLPPGSEPYRRLPSARLDWTWSPARWVEAGIAAEAVRFDHETLAGGQRVDLRPHLRLPFGGAAWYATPELAWRYTAYSLDDALVPPGGDSSPSRSLPVLSLDAGAFFERPLQWGDRGLLQTLEPRLFYLYAPYRDQDDLPLFDTQDLTFGWPGLFRSNRFGGGDRQADANQVTLAVTTRLLDASNGRELLSAGVGRIHYFEEPRVLLPGSPLPSDSGSAWVAEASLALTERWSLGLAHQWDPDRSQTDLSALRSQWRFSESGVVNASYRYRSGLLEQTDLSFALPLNTNWRLIGRWNYSLRDDQTLEGLAGLEWRSCCLAFRLVGRRYVREFSGEQNTAVYVELELNGLGSLGHDTGRLLEDAILGYSR